jgi:hypothetical protein
VRRGRCRAFLGRWPPRRLADFGRLSAKQRFVARPMLSERIRQC